MKKKFRLLLLLALLMTAATGAWAAAENETIIFNNLGLANGYALTSATLTVGNINLDFAKGTGSSTPAFYTSGGGTVRLYKGNTMSVDASGATITKIVFTYASEVTPEFSTGSYNSSTKTWEGEATTLTVTNAYTTNTQIRIMSMDVYYSAASGYTVSLKDGVKDADKWTVKVGEGQAQALPIGGLKGDGSETVTLQYNGRLKVKGVKATSDAAPAPAATVTTAPTATTGDIVAGSETALVSGGAATGGTLMYKVTTENTKPTSTEGFSADVPTAKTLAAGNYYVWYYVKADDSHTDSEISATAVTVTVKAATITVTWNNDDITGYGKSFTKEGVTITAGMIDFESKNFMQGGTFTTTLGNFTKIEVTTSDFSASGTGWSGSMQSGTWTGTPASSVSFSGNIMGMGGMMADTKFVFTIEPTN